MNNVRRMNYKTRLIEERMLERHVIGLVRVRGLRNSARSNTKRGEQLMPREKGDVRTNCEY